jgi:hypothetical protein
MSTLTFDTLKFAGVPATHAEAEANALSEIFETNLGELATKVDLREVETNLRHEIGDLRKDMDAKFEKTESALRQEISGMKFKLLKWLIGLAIAQAGLLIGLLKFLPKLGLS